MRPILERHDLTAKLVSGTVKAVPTVVQMHATITSGRMIIASAKVIGRDDSDAIFSLLILDEDGEPILDVTGQYIIGG